MFNKVHHVTYAVESVEAMAGYLDRNFALKPIKEDEFTQQGFKSILYRIGDTLVDFFEPLRDDSNVARHIRRYGTGVMHVAWGVDGIDQLFNDLKIKGNEMTGEAPSVSPFGYKTANIVPSSSHGIHFQLAEGDPS